MVQQVILIIAALTSWLIDYFTSDNESRKIRVLRISLLFAIISAGGFALFDAYQQRKDNRDLVDKIAELARKPDIVLLANGYEVTTNSIIPCTLSDGKYTLEFDFYNRSDKSASDATLSIILPDDFNVINAQEWRRMFMTSLPSTNAPAPKLNIRNNYQTRLGRALFPRIMESVGNIIFVETGEKTLTRSVFAEIYSIESGRSWASFSIVLTNRVEQPLSPR